jgi:hypothetical protein
MHQALLTLAARLGPTVGNVHGKSQRHILLPILEAFAVDIQVFA